MREYKGNLNSQNPYLLSAQVFYKNTEVNPLTCNFPN